MIVNIFAVVSLVVALAIVEARRMVNRRELRRRLGRMVSHPQRLRNWDWPDWPDRCELCGREMTLPPGRAKKITPNGEQTIYTCSICLVDPVQSICTAGNDSKTLHNRADLARPRDLSHRAPTTMPGGPQHPAGTF